VLLDEVDKECAVDLAGLLYETLFPADQWFCPGLAQGPASKVYS